MIRKGVLLLLVLASCDSVNVVSEATCDSDADLERARATFAICVGQGPPRRLSVYDDTVDLAEWIRVCGEQARVISCRTVRTAKRKRCAGCGPSATARCDRKPLPAWAADACEGQP